MQLAHNGLLDHNKNKNNLLKKKRVYRLHPHIILPPHTHTHQIFEKVKQQ